MSLNLGLDTCSGIGYYMYDVGYYMYGHGYRDRYMYIHGYGVGYY